LLDAGAKPSRKRKATSGDGEQTVHTKKKGKSIAKATVAKKPSANVYTASAPPSMNSEFPLTHLGCKIYRTAKSYRVVPSPKSKYDKTIFISNGNRAKAWKEVIEYCKHPYIPKTSANYVKL
jgi:hypothetical protein